jgi:hypothetical protein
VAAFYLLMRPRLAILLLVVLAGCTDSVASPSRSASPPVPGSASVSSSPHPRPGFGDQTLAVIEAFSGPGEPYYIQLAALDGSGGRQVLAMARSDKLYYLPSTACPSGGLCQTAETANYAIPETSISATRVYFLDGETSIKSLAGDWTVAPVRNIDAPTNSQVAFAVSPDDRRIAVSIITLATRPGTDTLNEVMYVEDLAGGTNRVQLYASTRLAEWPVGWHGGNVVVGVGSPDLGTYDNPYAATGYVLIDPATGSNVASLDCARGLLVAAGTACATGWCPSVSTCAGGTLAGQAWDGSRTRFALPSGPPPRVLLGNSRSPHLSPDGTRIAAEVVVDPQTGAVGTMVLQAGVAKVIRPDRAPLGWLDADHLAVSSGHEVDFLDLRVGTESLVGGYHPLPDYGTPLLLGVIPANLG